MGHHVKVDVLSHMWFTIPKQTVSYELLITSSLKNQYQWRQQDFCNNNMIHNWSGLSVWKTNKKMNTEIGKNMNKCNWSEHLKYVQNFKKKDWDWDWSINNRTETDERVEQTATFIHGYLFHIFSISLCYIQMTKKKKLAKLHIH